MQPWLGCPHLSPACCEIGLIYLALIHCISRGIQPIASSFNEHRFVANLERSLFKILFNLQCVFTYFNVVENCTAACLLSFSHTHTHACTVWWACWLLASSPIRLDLLYGVLRFLQRQSVSKGLLRSSSVLKTSSRQPLLIFFSDSICFHLMLLVY